MNTIFKTLIFLFSLTLLAACSSDDDPIVNGVITEEEDTLEICINEKYLLDTLVENLAGQGVVISNITHNLVEKEHPAVGYFWEPLGGILGMSEGLLMTTGQARLAKGPNDATNATGEISPFPMIDTDLESLLDSPEQLYDLVTIEFDITVDNDHLSFNYVFASEEYVEFVNQDFNDVFGFFISGPGIEDTSNLAVINNDTPISINTVNHLNNSEYYKSNGSGDSPASFSQLQYDGLTTVLKAETTVVAGEIYHIKLAITDVGDNYLDSGVFIESGSFTSLSLGSQVANQNNSTSIADCISH